jgi:hypothetical protein
VIDAELLAQAQRKGSDADYRRWVQRQPSALSGHFSEYLESGEGRCIAAHVRRAATSGTGYKGPYSCIPLTHSEHLVQHEKGESALKPKAWWDEQAEHYLRRWVAS